MDGPVMAAGLAAKHPESSIRNALSLRVNEVLDVVEPAKVLLLLLYVHVVGDEQSKRLVDAAVLKVPLHEDLEVLVESAERWAGVDGLGGVGRLGAGGMRQLGVLVEVHVLDNDGAILGDRLDADRALAGLLDHNVQAAPDGSILGTGLLVVELLLEVLGLAAVLRLALTGKLLICERAVLLVGLVLVAVEIGDGEGDGDPVGV